MSRVTPRCVAIAVSIAALSAVPAQAQRIASINPVQTIENAQFTGKVAVDAESNAALIGLSNGTVAVATRTTGNWTVTGTVLTGTTSSFGTAIEFDGGWALIAEDGTARTVRSYQVVNGTFEPRGAITAPAGIAADSLFGARMAISADGNWAAVSAYDQDLINVAGDNHGVVCLFERIGTAWLSRGLIGPGALAASKAEFGWGVALSGDGRRLAVIQSNLVHIYDRSASNSYDLVQVREPDPNHTGVWDVDLSEDGETLMAGLPVMANGTSSIVLYRRESGAWTRVRDKGGVNIGIGWKVAVNQSAAIASSKDYFTNGGPISALYAFGNDMEAVATWNIGDPQPTLGVQATDVNISMDGNWVFVGYANTGGLPAVKIFTIDTGIPSPVPGDLDGNLSTDLLWRHPGGRTVAWLMNGTDLASTATLLDSDSLWQIVGTGDFNRDKKIDLLWRDPDGRLMIWLMNGTTLQEATWIYPNPTSWRVAGTGDFNEDGFTDVVWQDTDGRVLVWYMNGTTMATPKYIATNPTDWVVSAIGDFNQDNHPDLVWQHPSGTALLWLLVGTEMLQAQSLLGSSTEWRISGARDFDHDGKQDLLWQHPQGMALLWLMNGTTLRVASSLRNDQTVWTVMAR